MAIVNCPECQGKVSDQAESCPHCGVDFSSCPDCGGLIKLYAEKCPHCGASISWGNNDDEKGEKSIFEKIFDTIMESLLFLVFVFFVVFCIKGCDFHKTLVFFSDFATLVYGTSKSDSQSNKTSDANKTQQDSRVKAIYKVYFNEKYTEFGKTGKFTLYKDGTGKFDIERVVENWSMFNDCQWSIESVSNPMSRGGDGNPVDVLAIKTASFGFIIDGSKKLFMTIEDTGLVMEIGHVVEE